jgi:hypothetical protein
MRAEKALALFLEWFDELDEIYWRRNREPDTLRAAVGTRD